MERKKERKGFIFKEERKGEKWESHLQQSTKFVI